MFGSFIPREGKFFDLFRDLAESIVQASKELQVFFATDQKPTERWSRNIKEIEHHGDEVTHRTVELLHKTFITPMDRDDIYRLVSRMDDILDFIDAASQRIFLYGVSGFPSEGKEMAEIIADAAVLVRSAVKNLDNLKEPDDIVKACVEINRLENDADHVLRSAVARLFKEEPDTRRLIMLKEIYELMETVTDRCEDVANIIEGIVLEYA